MCVHSYFIVPHMAKPSIKWWYVFTFIITKNTVFGNLKTTIHNIQYIQIKKQFSLMVVPPIRWYKKYMYAYLALAKKANSCN